MRRPPVLVSVSLVTEPSGPFARDMLTPELAIEFYARHMGRQPEHVTRDMQVVVSREHFDEILVELRVMAGDAGK